MADLTIPDWIADLGADALSSYHIAATDRFDAACEVLQATAPSLVSIELRAAANAFRNAVPGVDLAGTFAAMLDNRASELDGGA